MKDMKIVRPYASGAAPRAAMPQRKNTPRAVVKSSCTCCGSVMELGVEGLKRGCQCYRVVNVCFVCARCPDHCVCVRRRVVPCPSIQPGQHSGGL